MVIIVLTNFKIIKKMKKTIINGFACLMLVTAAFAASTEVKSNDLVKNTEKVIAGGCFSVVKVYDKKGVLVKEYHLGGPGGSKDDCLSSIDKQVKSLMSTYPEGYTYTSYTTFD
jgi:hypothetical protein